MFRILLLVLAATLLSSCGGKNVDYSYPKMAKDERESRMGNILTGDDTQGITLIGGDSKREDNGIGANNLLWQASLDVVNFMPIIVSDYEGGVISTDWYDLKGHGGARYKLTINVRGKELSANSLKVVMFKQTFLNGAWVSGSASPELVKEFEMKILNRAREIKMSGGQASNV